MAIDTNLAYSLGAGSGVDTKSLAKSLVEAEQVPRQQAIEAKIKTSESKISGQYYLELQVCARDQFAADTQLSVTANNSVVGKCRVV